MGFTPIGVEDFARTAMHPCHQRFSEAGQLQFGDAKQRAGAGVGPDCGPAGTR